jgi:hypothetical protein
LQFEPRSEALRDKLEHRDTKLAAAQAGPGPATAGTVAGVAQERPAAPD